jgi:hypothetical protein
MHEKNLLLSVKTRYLWVVYFYLTWSIYNSKFLKLKHFSFQESLLSTLLSVVENSKEQPHYSVTFPCKRTQEVSPKSGFVHSTLKKKSQISRTDSKGEILWKLWKKNRHHKGPVICQQINRKIKALYLYKIIFYLYYGSFMYHCDNCMDFVHTSCNSLV